MTNAEGATANRLSRRNLLQLGGVAVGTSTLGLGSTPRAYAADDFATIRDRRRDQLTGGDVDGSLPAVQAARRNLDESVSEARALLNPDTTAAEVFTDLSVMTGEDFDRSSDMATAFARLHTLASGYVTQGLATTGETALRDRTIAAVETLHTNLYKANASPFGNWYQWEIGAPIRIINILILLDDEVPADLKSGLLAAITWFTPDPNLRGHGTLAETGANRVNKAFNAVLRGALAEDADLAAQGRDACSDVAGGGRNSVFGYVTSGDGFYADGSFIQHNKIPYVGQYGASALEAMAPMFGVSAGTAYAITDPNKGVLLDAIEKTFAPFMWNGRMIDIARGRAVSRQRNRDYNTAVQVTRSVIMLADAVAEPYRTTYRRLAKGWIDRCTEDYFEICGLPYIAAGTELMADSTVTAAPEPVSHIRFPAQERSVHRRPGWLYTVGTSSTRIGRYEWGDSENNEGWYQGDGFGYLHLDADQDHYSDEYWPTVNPYRLPGVICSDVKRTMDATGGTEIPPAYEKFSGGVDLDQTGVVGASQLNFDKTLSAKQSWFLLDDRIVITAAGITSTVAQSVTTTIEHRNLGATADGFVGRWDGGQLPNTAGQSTVLHRPKWLHLSTVGGYLFLSDNDVEVGRERREGAWSRIDDAGTSAGDDTIQAREYVTATIDLGRQPTDASFAYAILPTASVTDVQRAAEAGRTRIVSNTAAAQVLQHDHILLGNFFAAATTPVLGADAICSVIVHTDGSLVTLAVADPTRTTTTLNLSLPRIEAGKIIKTDPGISVHHAADGATVSVDLTDSAAATKSVTWRRS